MKQIISIIALTLLIIGCNATSNNTTKEQTKNSIATEVYMFELLAVDEARAMNVEKMSQKDANAVGDIILTSKYDAKQKYLLKSKSIIDSTMVVDAEVSTNEFSYENMINIHFSKEGAEIFSNFTEKNTGKRVAIVLNSKVYSAPIIAQKISEGTVQITGDFSTEEALKIVNAMKPKKEK